MTADAVPPIASSGSSASSRRRAPSAPRFKDAQITMAHGAGRQGHPDADRGPARAGLRLAALGGAGATPATSRSTASRLALTTDSFVVKPIRFPGGSIGELAVNGTVNDLAVAGARPLALTLSLVLEEGLPADELRAEVEAIAAAARGGRRRDRRRRHEGRRARPRRRDVRLHHRHRRGRPARAALARPRLRPGDRILVSGTIGEHGTAIMLARGEFELDADIESDTRSLWPAVDALLEAAGPAAALPARRDPRRRRLGAERAGARVRRRDDRARGATCRCAPPVAGAAEILGHRPDVRRQRGQARRLRRPGGGATRRSPRCAPCRAARRRSRSAR